MLGHPAEELVGRAVELARAVERADRLGVLGAS
jgi:hypothetical protein